VLHGDDSADRARWLFIVDGIFTLLVAVWLVAYLPGDVTRTRGRWTKYSSKGWFDQRQQTIAVTRTIRDDPTKIKYLTTRVSWSDLKDALTDRFVWGHLILTSEQTESIGAFFNAEPSSDQLDTGDTAADLLANCDQDVQLLDVSGVPTLYLSSDSCVILFPGSSRQIRRQRPHRTDLRPPMHLHGPPRLAL
jgi:hypothetical protein